MDNKQADFFIEEHIRKKGLEKDTTILRSLNKNLYKTIDQINDQVNYLSEEILTKDIMINKRDQMVIDLNIKYTKERKKTKFYRNTTVIFASTTAILILLATIIIK